MGEIGLQENESLAHAEGWRPSTCICGAELPPSPSRQASLDLLLSRAWMTPVCIYDLMTEACPEMCPACIHSPAMRGRAGHALRRAAAAINRNPDLACLVIQAGTTHFIVLPKTDAAELRAQQEMELRRRLGWL